MKCGKKVWKNDNSAGIILLLLRFVDQVLQPRWHCSFTIEYAETLNSKRIVF